jgi:hypothetical protein
MFGGGAFSLGPLTFAAPAALMALMLLPLLWWLLRATPPSPLRARFPPFLLLAALRSVEESAFRTPLWLLLLRLLLALALILGAAHPLIHARDGVDGAGPLILVADDGWAAAPGWQQRQALLRNLIEAAGRRHRSVVLATTAAVPPAGAPPLAQVLPAARALDASALLQPKPWAIDRPATLAALDALRRDGTLTTGTVVWLSDGLTAAADGAGGTTPFAQALRRFGDVTAVMPKPAELPQVLRPGKEGGGAGLSLSLVRPDKAAAATAVLALVAEDDSLLGRHEVPIAAGTARADVTVALPAEWLGRLARIEIEGQRTAAAVVLADDRWRRHPVGLITGGATDDGQPLLGGLYYLERAFEPFAEVRRGEVGQLLQRDLALLVLADDVPLDAAAVERVRRWVEHGGALVRFAGPRLAQSAAAMTGDPLLPVPLRAGDRVMGGALSWEKPGTIAAFDAESPLYGLVPPADVHIGRQVLAQPSLDLAGKTWARLADGTPLVTAARQGDGWLVLVHTTANTEWSDLPLSGFFVDMLQRMAVLGRGVAGADDDGPPLAALTTLDGFGRLGPPPAHARPIAAAAFALAEPGWDHPPGYYGRDAGRSALNLSPSLPDPEPLPPVPAGIRSGSYDAALETDLRPWLLGWALLLALADLAASLVLRGLVRLPLRRSAAAVALVLVLVPLLRPAAVAAAGDAVGADGSAHAASLTTRLAYVLTGDAATDALSRAGLAGLGLVVNRRTAAELSEPAGVDLETDELAFYPLLYWPLVPGRAQISPAAAHRLKAYMRTGGLIVFDTRRQEGGDSPDLRALAAALDLPPLIVVPADHVLHRAYYLLTDLPGRWTGRPVWIEPGGEHVNDGVTAVVAGSHDWIGAWAVDDGMRPLLPVVPGGERQRELAYRFGINLVMHVLTGSYKADQVHLPAILERLGQ